MSQFRKFRLTLPVSITLALIVSNQVAFTIYSQCHVTIEFTPTSLQSFPNYICSCTQTKCVFHMEPASLFSPGCTDGNFLIFLHNNQLDFVFMETKKQYCCETKAWTICIPISNQLQNCSTIKCFFLVAAKRLYKA